MPVSLPMTTGDAADDAWKLEVSQAINAMQTGTGGTSNTTVVQAGGRATTVNQQGLDGVNHASLLIFQRTSLNQSNGLTPPSVLTTDLQFTYSQNTLLARDIAGNFTVDGPWDGWYPSIPDRDPILKDDYVWFQSVNIADRRNFDFIDSNTWSAVGLYTAPGIGALRAVTSYNQIVNADDVAFDATIDKLYLGEVDVTGQIPNDQICWLITEPDGTIAVDGEGFENQAQLDTALSSDTYTDRNFFQASEGPIGGVAFGARHVGYTTTFTEDELFTATTTDPDAGGEFADVSRDIEIRINIDNVVYI